MYSSFVCVVLRLNTVYFKFLSRHFFKLCVSWCLHIQHPRGQNSDLQTVAFLMILDKKLLPVQQQNTIDVRSSVKINALLNASGSQTQIKI